MPHDSTSPRARRTYYATGEITVTGAWLTFAGHQFAVAELHELRVDTTRPSQRPLALAAAAMLFPLVSAFSGVRGAQWIGVALLTCGTLVAAAILRHRRPAPRLLVANYQGRPTVVYEHTDERVFNQVARAVLRAYESHPRDAVPAPGALSPERSAISAVTRVAEAQLGE